MMTDNEYLKIIEDAKAVAGVGPYFMRAETRDMLAFAKMIAARVETYQCECGADEACEFVRQRDEALAAKYATTNPLGGPATMFEVIASRLRAGEDYQAVMDDYGIRLEAGELPERRMVVCPNCGNKRCPRAAGTEYACTGSNAPGQIGIAPYPDFL